MPVACDSRSWWWATTYTTITQHSHTRHTVLCFMFCQPHSHVTLWNDTMTLVLSGAKPRGVWGVQTPHTSQRRFVGFAQIRWDISSFRKGVPLHSGMAKRSNPGHSKYRTRIQDAQLSQRDRIAGYISFGRKWKTGTQRQYFTDIASLASTTVT